MPSHKTIPRQWDDSICREFSRSPSGTSVRLTQRALQERKKKANAFLSVRPPQKELDPRIYKIAENKELMGDEFPYLHYGLLVPLDFLHPYVARNDIKVSCPAPPGSSDPYDMASALYAVAEHLSDKCNMTVNWALPFEEPDKHLIFTLDDTLYLNQKYAVRRRWEERVASTVRVLRKELDLGDQEAMWWWDCICGTRYYCPLEDYNPPQLNAEERLRNQPYKSDSDSDSDSGSVTEME